MSFNKVYCNIVALLLCLPLVVTAQIFAVHTLPTQHKLPVASVHCIMQDSEGYMWYATEGGLCRDNGYQIDVFRPAGKRISKESCDVRCLSESWRGDILFGTADGLYAVDKRDYVVRHVSVDSLDTYVESLFTDRKGRTWIGTRGRVYVRSGNDSIVCTYPCMLNGKAASVAGFYEDGNGNVYVMKWGGGMSVLEPGRKALKDLLWPLDATPLQMLEDNRHGGFLMLTGGAGIQRMRIEGEKCILTPQSATTGDHERNHGLCMLYDDRYGLVWETTLNNLYAYYVGADGELNDYSLAGLLPAGNKILDQMYQSRDGSIYVSGFIPHTFVISAAQSGMKRFTADAVSKETGFPVLADMTVSDGRYMWIWQGRRGLILYDVEADVFVAASRKFDKTVVRSSKGGIWASDGAALFRLWQDGGQVREESVCRMPDGCAVKCMYESGEHTLFVATGKHLYRLMLIGGQLEKVADLKDSPVDMCADNRGNVYLAMKSNGLCVVAENGKFERIDDKDEAFLSVACMADGTVWTSTYEGNVYKYVQGTWHLERETLLCSSDGSAVKCLRTDGLGHVWTLTDQCVCEYAPQSRAVRMIRNNNPFVNASYFSTLENIDQNHVGINGAGAIVHVQSSVELGQQTASNVQPRVASVLSDGRVYFIGRDESVLELDAEEQNITINLTTLDHLHADGVCFAYQLEGVNDEWIYLPQGVNSIILTNLTKGSNMLRVIATDRYGCWSEPTAVLTIQRAPFWYETWWAYLLYGIAALLTGYGLFRLERRIQLLRGLIRRKREVRLDEIEMKREDVAVQQRDDTFLRQVVAKVEENLGRPDYNVEVLSEDMCMSRITLYRRMQELTGLAPTEFIRDIRLKKAAQLLAQSPDASVADVARKVGFSTPKYFSRCFKEKFGVQPSDYAPRSGTNYEQ